MTFQALCRVKGKARFALVKASDTGVVYDELVVDSAGQFSDTTLVTLRLQVSTNGPSSYAPALVIENLADSGGTQWQVFWQQAWGGSEASMTYPLPMGLANATHVRTPGATPVANTYNWAINALGIKAASRFQLPLLDTSSGGDAIGMGWLSPVASEDYDLVDGEIYFDQHQLALMSRADDKWYSVVQPERVALNPGTPYLWTGGGEKNLIFDDGNSATVSLDTTVTAVPRGSFVRVFHLSTNIGASIVVKVGTTTVATLGPQKMAEFLFYVAGGTGYWVSTQKEISSNRQP